MSSRTSRASIADWPGTAVRGLRWIAAGGAPLAGALVGQWLLRLAWPSAPFLPYAIGDAVIRRTPGDLATNMIERFGAFASDLLTLGIVAALMIPSILARRARRGWVGLAVFGVSLVAFELEPVALQTWPLLLSAALGGVVAGLLAEGPSAVSPHPPPPSPPRGRGERVRDPALRASSVVPGPALTPGPSPTAVGEGSSVYGDERDRSFPGPSASRAADRRRFLATSGAFGLLGLTGAWAAVTQVRGPASLERVAATVPLQLEPDGTFPEIAGLSPRITAPADHYVVDIDLNRPVIEAGDWKLTIDGDVGAPRSFTFADIQAMPTTEFPLHMHCISNAVGGKLMSNAVWTGFPLTDLLALVSPGAGARLAKVVAADDYDEVISLADAGAVFVAWAMGGQRLATAHGYPVRLLLPGHYGVRSVKWVTRLELGGGPGEGYWPRRGWNDAAVMKTGARIDTPGAGQSVAATTRVAGVAWAGTRGVANVEVSGDAGATWVEAQLEAISGPLAWTRWRVELRLRSGDQELWARATDGEGMVQTAERSFPHPSGATGYHRVAVSVG